MAIPTCANFASGYVAPASATMRFSNSWWRATRMSKKRASVSHRSCCGDRGFGVLGAADGRSPDHLFGGGIHHLGEVTTRRAPASVDVVTFVLVHRCPSSKAMARPKN